MKQIEKVDIFLYIFVMCYILKMKLNFIWKNINSIYNFNIHPFNNKFFFIFDYL